MCTKSMACVAHTKILTAVDVTAAICAFLDGSKDRLFNLKLFRAA